jgi:hypothetical protein
LITTLQQIKHGIFMEQTARGHQRQQLSFNVGSFNYVDSAITSIDLHGMREHLLTEQSNLWSEII